MSTREQSMQTFAIISLSEKIRLEKRTELLNKHKIKPYSQIIIKENEGAIANVRQAQRQLQFGLEKNHWQALIIENVGLLTLAAQQALLKTLEEPPPNTLIILEAQNHEQLLPTILSRAEIIYIPYIEVVNSDEEKRITLFWSKLIRNQTLKNRLQATINLMNELPDRKLVEKWLDQQIIFFHHLLVKRTGDKLSTKNLSPLKIVKILRLSLFTKKNLSANVNLKLLLDNFFLDIPMLK